MDLGQERVKHVGLSLIGGRESEVAGHFGLEEGYLMVGHPRGHWSRLEADEENQMMTADKSGVA